MSRPLIILLGIASFLSPLGLLAVGIVAPALLDTSVILGSAETIDRAHRFLGALGLVVMLFYVALTLRSPRVPSEKRWLWVTVLVLANIFSLPFFWLWYVWQNPASAGRT